MKKGLLKTITGLGFGIVFACSALFSCEMNQNKNVVAEGNSLNIVEMDMVPINHHPTNGKKFTDGDYYPLNFTLSQGCVAYGYEITFANFGWDDSSVSSYHQIMALYDDGQNGGGAGYLFCNRDNLNWRFQIGGSQDQVMKSVNNFDPRTMYQDINTISVEVRFDTGVYSIHDTLGLFNVTNKSWNVRNVPYGKQIALAYNCKMVLYGCRVWEEINGEKEDQVDVTPAAYFDEESQQVVIGINDDVSGESIFDETTFTEMDTSSDFVSVVYMNGDELFATDAYILGKVNTEITSKIPTQTGKRFVGWYDAKTGGNKVTSIPSNLQNNLILHARFEDIMHNVTYKSGDSVISTNGATQFAENDGLDLSDIVPSVNPTGMKFVGWYDASEGGNKVTEIAGGTKADVTIFAQFAYSEEAFADNFLNIDLCDGGVTAPSKQLWQSLAEEYSNLGSAEKDLFRLGNADENGTDIEKCLARYDYIIGKYGVSNYADFMGRNPDPIFGSKKLEFNGVDDDKGGTIVVTTVGASLLLISVGFILKKKKLS